MRSLHQNIPDAKDQLHHVLLICDNGGICDYDNLQLSKKVKFEKESNTVDAISYLKSREHKISSIILDLELEDKQIIDFLQTLKRNLEWNYIPTLVTTSENQDRRLIEHIDAGAFYYLSKTSDADLMSAVLGKALKDYTTYTFYLNKAVNQNISNLITEGRFRLKTFKEAHEIADWLASLCGHGKVRDDIVVGFNEILLNAIEHGNLGVTYNEKTELMKEGDYMEKLVTRLSLPQYQDKHVEVSFLKNDEHLSVEVIDMGDGFDFEKYLVLDKTRMFHSHGKGILMAKNLYFDELSYQEPGNKVSIKINLS